MIRQKLIERDMLGTTNSIIRRVECVDGETHVFLDNVEGCVVLTPGHSLERVATNYIIETIWVEKP